MHQNLRMGNNNNNNNNKSIFKMQNLVPRDYLIN